ncbi:ABC transporter ATP-binding protein [Pandoraea bronchicola]|uniref:ABC transporter ATP-binding protein n=1 Tax=Pandoraea bronchicola TaxID=2508287 RepID=A0A5E5BSB1_9BURK|nr:ABC transporter ATP-binding protein [Pandoraea bronchicola]VVE89181.1 ABC transporter ATP-binding protein [Pandoraea bronchicola]
MTHASPIPRKERDVLTMKVMNSPVAEPARPRVAVPGDLPAAPAISLHQVAKTFEGAGVRALDPLSLEVPRGEFVAVLGPSGCGKSTLLRLIGGLYPCDAPGVVRVFGDEVKAPSPHVGIVFQTYNLLPWLNVVANLCLCAQTRGMPRKVIDERVPGMLQVLGLADFAARYPHELSGGMRQRVALGQALITQPDLLLLDEPFGALDALTRDRLNVELLRLCQANRQSVLLVTHSIDEAVFMADRVLVMSPRPGRVVHDIRIDLPRPRDPKVTRLLPEYGRLVTELGEIMGVA